MNETLTTTNKSETRDVETVLQDKDATVDELMTVTTGNPNQLANDEHTTVVTSGTSFYDEFNLNPRDVEIGAVVIGCVSLVIALIVFFAFTMRKKAPRGAFLRKVKEFLNFRKVWIAGIIKFVYLFLALSLTIGCIVLMFFGGANELKMILLCFLTAKICISSTARTLSTVWSPSTRCGLTKKTSGIQDRVI